MTDYRIIACAHGGPEVLQRLAIERHPLRVGEVLIRHTAIGVNFVDTYHRSGLYKGPLPAPLGGEAAGIVEEVGPGVDGFSIGDRVAYGTGGQGAYATLRTIPAEHLFQLPEGISDRTAAALMLKGLTCAYLVGPCAMIQAGQTVLVHAAAGGVGSILVPWLVDMGARVIGHVGTTKKEEQVRRAGAHRVLSCPPDRIAAEVRKFAREGADVVFDGVGASTWEASLASLKRRGLMVSFGNASGPVPQVSPLDLSRAGSIFLTRPTLRDYTTTLEERRDLAASLFAMIRRRVIAAQIGLILPLADAAKAHRLLEGRQTTGATLLVP